MLHLRGEKKAEIKQITKHIHYLSINSGIFNIGKHKPVVMAQR